jgi:Ca2+/H+ antiporter
VITLPPIFFYAIGTLLVVFGALRAVVLGRRRADRELTEETPERAKARKRHLAMGIVWLLMGLFLIFSTAGILSRR